jgi:BNR repeat-like domain
VLVSEPNSALAHSEPHVVENPANPKNLVAGSKFFSDPQQYLFKIGTFFSMDGGRTWHDNGLLPGFDRFLRNSDISFAFSPNGSVVYACVLAHGINDLPNGIYVSQSRDGGQTWSNPVTVWEDPIDVTFSDKPWIAVDWSKTSSRGLVYVGWNLDEEGANADGGDHGSHSRTRQTAGPKTGIVVSRSMDYGKTWSAPSVVRDFTAGNGNFALGAIPDVGQDGHVYVAYIAYDDVVIAGKTQNVARMVVADSPDHGVSWRHHIAVPIVNSLPDKLKNGTFRNYSMPTFAVSQHDSSMVMAWADMKYGEADILSTRSVDGGKTWSAPILVNHTKPGDGKDKFQPALAVAPNGTYTCAWFDRRFDPGDRLIDVEIAQSTNGGQSFGRNIRVTSQSWDPAIDAPHPPGNVTFIGDYQGLAVDNRTVHPLWNDTQDNSTQEIRTAVIDVKLFTLK